MKTKFGIIFYSLFIGVFSSISFASNKHALIVALSEYDLKETGFAPIHAKNDIELVKNALILKGFTTQNIAIIDDSKGTKLEILEAFKGLIERANLDDVVVVHISSHGQQIMDDNGDELDGYDEAIVPLDGKIIKNYNNSNYSGNNHIRDDEISGLLTQLRIKIGKNGNVLFIGDFCHSGSSSRGIGSIRGTNKTFEGTSEKPNNNETFGLDNTNRDAAELVCYYASSPKQKNYETIDDNLNVVGSLSYAFSKAFSKNIKDQTYRELFNSIERIMSVKAPNQTPQFEGELDKLVLQGNISLPRMYYKVSGIVDVDKVKIDIGKLEGLSINSTIEFYDSELEKIIAEGVVIKTYLLESIVKLDNKDKFNRNVILNSNVKVESLGYKNMELKVFVDMKTASQNKIINAHLKKRSFIKLLGDKCQPDLIISNLDFEGNKVILKTNSGLEVFNGAYSTKSESDFVSKLFDFARSIYLKNIDAKIDNYKVDIEILKVGHLEDVELSKAYNQLRPNDKMRIKLTNSSNYKLYFAALDIQPDGKVNCMLPDQINLMPEECIIMPNSVLEFPLNKNDSWTIYPPCGREIIKLFVSENPVFICDILDQNFNLDRSGKLDVSLQALLQPILNTSGKLNEKRGLNETQTTIGIETKVFDIVE